MLHEQKHTNKNLTPIFITQQQHMNIKIYKFTDKKTKNSHLIDLKKDYDLVD